ncbi:hypothetical protein AB1L30_22255 [Bremerella sp. JC817]|uniref:hypothetical protein n=1 Tax=Bremerella sp. JC817 TaxID=3231756 RepID=UPI00345863DE
MDFETAPDRAPVDWVTPAWKLGLIALVLGLFAAFRGQVVFASLPYLQYLPGTLLALVAISYLRRSHVALALIVASFFVGLLLTPVVRPDPPRRWYLYLESFGWMKLTHSLPLLGCVLLGTIVAIAWVAWKSRSPASPKTA